MNRDWLMRGAGYILAAFGALIVIVFLLIGALAFTPILILFAGFWWACPMSWESEFEHETKRLLKGK